jgi:hypothetical protein
MRSVTLALAGALIAVTGFGCGGGKVATDGLYAGRPGVYRPIQMEIDITDNRSLNYVVLDLYGPAEFARQGTRFAPDAKQAGFVMKPSADSAPPVWQYYQDGTTRWFSHQEGLLILRAPDGVVNTIAVPAGPVGRKLYDRLWGGDVQLRHVRAADPNGLALPLIRTLESVDEIRTNEAFADWYGKYQRWYQGESGGAPTARK